MLTIVLSIILAIIIAMIIMYIAMKFFDTEWLEAAARLGVFTILLGLLGGIFLPISGYHEWELVSETQLITLSNNVTTQGMIFVERSADNVYTYRYEIDSEFGTETSREYDTRTIPGKFVEEVEDPNCKVPVLREYEKKAKRSIWTFAIGAIEYKYIFYVPEGTISQEIKLN